MTPNTKLREALELAIRQNSHDMLMTGEEIRQCEQALALTQHEEDKPTLYYKALEGGRAKQDGRCYDICFAPVDGYTPLYARAAPPAEKASTPERFNAATCDQIAAVKLMAEMAETRAELIQRGVIKDGGTMTLEEYRAEKAGAESDEVQK